VIEVCVVGELNLDLILYGFPNHLSPDVELLANGMGSSSAIFAAQFVRAGYAGRFCIYDRQRPFGEDGVGAAFPGRCGHYAREAGK
jgi:hypothetical protein